MVCGGVYEFFVRIYIKKAALIWMVRIVFFFAWEEIIIALSAILRWF